MALLLTGGFLRESVFDFVELKLWKVGTPSSNSSGVMISTKNLSGTSNSATLANVAPYNLKGAAVVNVSGQAISVTGTNVSGVTNSMVFGAAIN